MDKQLTSLYQNRDFVGMANMLEDYTPEALAGVLGEVADGDLVLLCRELNPDTVADALIELPADRQKIILAGMFRGGGFRCGRARGGSGRTVLRRPFPRSAG